MIQRIRNRYQELLSIKERREGRRITQRVAAEEIGVTTVTIGRYARNEVERYDESTILAMCKYLGCTLAEFLVIEEVDGPGEQSPEHETALAMAL